MNWLCLSAFSGISSSLMSNQTSKAELLRVSKEACDELAVFVRELYSALSGDAAKLKEDKSVFTIADGIVQETLKSCLFAGNKFEAIVGEEDSSNINLKVKPYTVDDLVVADKFVPAVDRVVERLTSLGQTIDHEAYRSLTIFIDPIDGTREFYTKLGEQCSICIGFAEEGLPVAGLVYRPIPNPATWAAGCKAENHTSGNLEFQEPPHANGLLTTNGSISKFTEVLMDELKCERVRSGGAGNKMMMVLEGKGTYYIQDRGVSRWDTCAAQAIIEAHGGALVKLAPFVEAKELQSYTYRKTEENLDFVPGMSNLTPYNARVKGFEKGTKAESIDQVQPYSNLNGLFAVSALGLKNIDVLHEAIQKAKAVHPPAFD